MFSTYDIEVLSLCMHDSIIFITEIMIRVPLNFKEFIL
jgi:hypothetical protein